jgi:hypothetical protein
MFSLPVCCVRDVPFGLVKMNEFFKRFCKQAISQQVFVVGMAAVLQQRENC